VFILTKEKIIMDVNIITPKLLKTAPVPGIKFRIPVTKRKIEQNENVFKNDFR
jgi:hypothetical protein